MQATRTSLKQIAIILVLSASVSSAASAQTPQGTVAVRESDPLWNGALIGAGAGVATGLLYCSMMEPWEICRDDFGSMLKFGALGAGIGMAVDAVIRKKIVQTASGVEVYTGALIRRRDTGVQLSVRF